MAWHGLQMAIRFPSEWSGVPVTETGTMWSASILADLRPHFSHLPLARRLTMAAFFRNSAL